MSSAPSISAAIEKGLASVTKKWCKQRKQEERHLSARANRRYVMTRSSRVTLKEAAYEVLPEAYAKASSNGRLPAHARQIMYAARTKMLQLTGRDSLNDAYFTQVLLPDYMNECPRGWNVVFDARGTFREPHQGQKGKDIPLGTIGVRNYLATVEGHIVEAPDFGIVDGYRYPTRGPQHRFSTVLFIEKEGFFPLLEEARIAEKYDLAIMTTKGVSNVASRVLLDDLSVTVLVLHDFDLAGFKIFGTLKGDTRRHHHTGGSNIIDLGLRLKDVEACGLESEPAVDRLSEGKLREYGATDEEIEYLQSERVELNAFMSEDLLEWLEAKLEEHGVKKIIPDEDTLHEAYLRAVEVRRVEAAVQKAVDAARKNGSDATVPEDLEETIRDRLEEDPTLSWDEVIQELVDPSEEESS